MRELNIYKRKDGRYEGRITRGRTENGKRSYQYFFGKTKQAVQTKMKSVQRLLALTTELDLTIEDLYDEWLLSIQHRVKESTTANYQLKAEKHILPNFGKKRVSELSSEAIYQFIQKKKADGLSNRYIADILIEMKSIFKYAVRKYHIVNPLDGITMPKVKKPEIQLLDEKEQKKLQEYLFQNPSRSNICIALTMATGLRIGELCGLQWADIDLKKRILTVRKTVQRIRKRGKSSKTEVILTEPKSESSKRSIPIPEFLIPYLEKFQGEADEFLLSGKKTPTEPRTLQYRFAKILKNGKLPSVHFHALRHMFASKCIKLGFDVKTLSEILGHSNVEITLNRYVHSSFEQKVAYMSRIQMGVECN